VKWILSKKFLCFGKEKHVLMGYTDANLAGDIDSPKPTFGYLATFAGGGVLAI